MQPDCDGDDGDGDHRERREPLAKRRNRTLRFPGDRGGHSVRIDARLRVAGQQFEKRRQRRAAAYRVEDEWRPPVAARVDLDRRRADPPIEWRLASLNLADVLQRDL